MKLNGYLSLRNSNISNSFVKIHSGANAGQVAEGLRNVAYQLTVHVHLFGEDAQVICEREGVVKACERFFAEVL